MPIEERLKKMIIDKYGSVLKFTTSVGLPNSTMATILKKGVHNANVVTINKICIALGISADELARDRIVYIDTTEPTEPRDAEQMIQSVLNGELTVDGIALTDYEKRAISDAIVVVIGVIRRRRERGDSL